MKDSERRNFERLTDEISVRISKKLSKEQYIDITVDVGKSINISASGLLIHVKEKINVGEMLKIKFLVPNSFDFFEGSGEVVRSEKEGSDSNLLAVNFIKLSKSDKKMLDYYITLCKKDYIGS